MVGAEGVIITYILWDGWRWGTDGSLIGLRYHVFQSVGD